MVIGVVDYGVGNIFSILKACVKSGLNYRLVKHPDEVKECDVLLLPGVGAFPVAMKNLVSSGLDEAIVEASNLGKRIVGVCVGMQLLLSQSLEFETTKGLGLINGTVTKLPNAQTYRVPNIGWCQVYLAEGGFEKKFRDLVHKKDFYFAHSYYCNVDNDAVLAYVDRYNDRIPVIITNNENVFGIQFHPEISGNAGNALFEKIVLG